MGSVLGAERVQGAHPVVRPPEEHVRPVAAVLVLIAAGWLIAIGAQLTGRAGLLHHHALIEGGQPLWIAVLLFLISWQVMIVAMMLPASLPRLRIVRTSGDGLIRPREAAFLSAFAVVWTFFGLLAFTGDLGLHRLVDANPWLAARPWLVESAALVLAGVFQLTPLKRRSLAACRHPIGRLVPTSQQARTAFGMGLDHGIACAGSSGGLMLLMFAEGFANLWWMVALTALMVYEATGQHGQRAASLAGIALLLMGMAVLGGQLVLLA